MTWEPDDLPAGFPDMWSPLVTALRTHWVAPVSGVKLGVSRRDDLTDAATVEARKAAARGHSATHYAKARLDPAWVAKRRAYYRARYAASKARVDTTSLPRVRP